jgi:microcompartment protein CcmL/EutN
MPYLTPSLGRLVLILGGGVFIAFITGPVASLRAALKIGQFATSAIIREGE